MIRNIFNEIKEGFDFLKQEREILEKLWVAATIEEEGFSVCRQHDGKWQCHKYWDLWIESLGDTLFEAVYDCALEYSIMKEMWVNPLDELVQINQEIGAY